MLNQTFTTKNLRALLRKKDFIQYKLEKKNDAYLVEIEKISNDINSDIFFDADIKYVIVKGKGVFDANSLHNSLVLRKLNDNIKRLYKIKPSDRVNTVKKICCVLEDMVPMWVTKLDIKEFYESINKERILSKLYTDSLLSYQSKKILKALFEIGPICNNHGLPRGLSVSSTLSELYLRSMDKLISAMEGVYFYARYVDDIIIFSYQDSKSIYASISKYVETDLKMSLNHEKTMSLKLNCRCTELCKCGTAGSCKLICMCNKSPDGDIRFDYLGYGFKLGAPGKKDAPAKPIVYLSDKKVKKYKTRVLLAFRSFIKTKDYELLVKRIKFLTGNCLVDPFDTTKKLKTGIYYNYQLLNDTTALLELDKYYIKTLYSKKGSLGAKLSLYLGTAQKEQLRKYKFISGYENKIFHAFTGPELSQVQECWQI